jgi:hypothetical protein
MLYKSNINKIDYKLKETFSDVIIDNSDYRQLEIKCNFLSENKNIDLVLVVSQKNLNIEDPLLEWGYYTNPIKKDNLVKFNSKIDNMTSILNEIISKDRLDLDYLKEAKIKFETDKIVKINESLEEIDSEIENINQTYELRENYLLIDRTKIKKFLESKGFFIDIEDIYLEHYDPTTGKNIDLSIYGNVSELHFDSISSNNMNGNMTLVNWAHIENILRKMPRVEDVSINTSSYKIIVEFSTKLLVEFK